MLNGEQQYFRWIVIGSSIFQALSLHLSGHYMGLLRSSLSDDFDRAL